MPQSDCSCEENRESGESPERSGHCKQGHMPEIFEGSHCVGDPCEKVWQSVDL